MSRRAVYLVLLCSALLHINTIASDMIFYHMCNLDGTLTFIVSRALAYLLYPFLGWLADVYFTRHSFILASSIATIVGTILMIITAVTFLVNPNMRILGFFLSGLSIIVMLIAMGLLESTIIQFGMDQMLEASSSQLSTFIHGVVAWVPCYQFTW